MAGPHLAPALACRYMAEILQDAKAAELLGKMATRLKKVVGKTSAAKDFESCKKLTAYPASSCGGENSRFNMQFCRFKCRWRW